MVACPVDARTVGDERVAHGIGAGGREVLALPAQERARIASDLLASLDSEAIDRTLGVVLKHSSDHDRAVRELRLRAT